MNKFSEAAERMLNRIVLIHPIKTYIDEKFVFYKRCFFGVSSRYVHIFDAIILANKSKFL
ncbi:hypothetical protein C4F40_21100 [Sphingobacterium sp. Ka21]|uniref:Uncharacterized protein n=1 Tax=Sphingobacterium pedocola TaxID=2082722 RepID=A0ABR9TD18_9SPHI|nr:hypothetical protein [Sphingobacterium pedocola]